MCPTAANVNARPALLQHTTAIYPGHEQDVIPSAVARYDPAIEKGMAVSQNWGAVEQAFDSKSHEGILSFVEALAEMTHQFLLPLAEDVDGDRLILLQPAQDPACLIECNDNLWRFEGALLYPAAEHPRFLLAVPKRQNEQPAWDATEGGSHGFLDFARSSGAWHGC
jgi:hypothetical protein